MCSKTDIQKKNQATIKRKELNKEISQNLMSEVQRAFNIMFGITHITQSLKRNKSYKVKI